MDSLQPFLDYLKNPETPFGLFDLGYGIFLFFGLIRGLFRGLPDELSQLLGTVIIFFGSMKFYPQLSSFIMEHTRLEDPTASMALSYLLIILCLLVIWKLITFLLRKVLDWTCPKQIRRFGGAAVGMLKNAVMIAVVLGAVLISGHQTLEESMINQSWFGRQVRQILPESIDFKESEPSPAEETEADGSGDA